MQVLLAISASYPSSDVRVRLARDALLAALPDAVCPYALCTDSLYVPKISHNMSLLHFSAYHTSVCENGAYGFSPYLCPFIGTSYSAYKSTQYLKSRIDRRHFLYKLSHRTLICNCHLLDYDCWVRILQIFCVEFAVRLSD